MKHSQRVFLNRILSGVLVFVLVVGVILNPVTMLPTFATDSLVKLNYKNHNRSAVELYVQTDEVNYKPGDEMELTLYVQNNSDEMLSGVGLSWDGDKDVFSETEFVGVEELGAETNEKGNVENLNLEAGEVVSLGFMGTLNEDLEDLNRKKISFFYGAETESGETVTDRTYFEFTVGLFDELSVEFEDGNVLVPDEMSELHIRMSFNDLGYYYEAEDGGEDAAELATDSNTITATDSNTELATDSNAELATDSNTELATGSDAEVATDSDTEEETVEEYVFEINDVSLNLDTYGAEFKNVVLKDTMVTEEQAEIVTTALFELDEEAEAGEYFGTLQAVVKSGKKEYKAEIGFQFEVVNETVTTGFKKHGLFTADVDNFTVHVQVPKGAFDEKVELSVTELAEDSEAYQEAEEAMANHDRVYDGMMALDICFLNEDGEEVEPKEGYNVQVSIEMNADVLPEGIDTESLMVHHIAETATASDAAEVVVEDVADSADVTAGLIEVKETVEAPVVAAEFEVERFSTFTITWSNSSSANVSYYLADGTPITLNDSGSNKIEINNTNYNSFKMSTYAPLAATGRKESTTDNNTYSFSFVRAELLDTSGTEIIRYDNIADNSFRARREGNKNYKFYLQYYDKEWKNVPNGYTIKLIYEELKPLETFKGLDTSDVIGIHVVDYKDGQTQGNFKIGQNGSGINGWTDKDSSGNSRGVRQGIVENTLLVANGDTEGYPSVKGNADNQKSLKSFFTGGIDANYLFQKDERGYYYFDSYENFAHLNTSNGEFVLNRVPHAIGDDINYGDEPQFMPFNTIGYPNVSVSEDSSYYSFQEDKNYLFGMMVEFDFTMPKDGMIDGKPMVFEFAGDDDVWVFIDDVLVLDMGGVHLSCEGSINFATGKVLVDRIYNPNNNTTPTTFDKTVYLDDLYEEAKRTSSVEWQKCDGVNDVNIYADYTKHTLKFFYMERGKGGSNCTLKFNIQPLPSGTINFEKEIGYTNVADANDIDFKFKAFVDKDGKENSDESYVYEPYIGPYKVYDADNRTWKRDAETDESGVFLLKDGEMASIAAGITAKSRFYIQEIGATSDKYDVYINDSYIEENIPGEEDNTFTGVQSSEFTAGTNPYIKFKNNVVVDNQFNVTIRKDMIGGITPGETFDFNLLLGTKETIYTGKYDIYTVNSDGTIGSLLESEKVATNGIIKIEANQCAKIVGLVGGNTIKVKEANLNEEGYWEPTYKISGALDPNSVEVTGYAKGTALEGTQLKKEGGSVDVVVTNKKKVTYTTVTLDKVVAGNFGDRTKMFTFTVTVDGTVSTYELGDYTPVVTIEDVPLGATISITESDNTGYEVNAEVTNTESETFTGNTLTFKVSDKTGHAVVFTNTKNAVIDTGITMDTMPYILILLAVIGCIAFVVIRKRKDDDLD